MREIARAARERRERRERSRRERREMPTLNVDKSLCRSGYYVRFVRSPRACSQLYSLVRLKLSDITAGLIDPNGWQGKEMSVPLSMLSLIAVWVIRLGPIFL